MAGYKYDLCVIGAGMFGSAAAKHASANPSIKVCLIGPKEPTNEEWEDREIFGSHYDEARIVDTIEPEAEIQVLSKESIAAYRQLERLSGISFYYPVGLLNIGRKRSPWMEKCEQGASKRIGDCVLYLSKENEFRKRFPFIEMRSKEYAIFDDSGAGYINPRTMIKAQLDVATKQGCHIIYSVVNEVTDSNKGYHKVVTETGVEVYAKRVLFATGAFTNFKKFDPLPKLNITPIKETVALLKISDDEAERLAAMPCITYRREEDGFLVYILPPVKYPDGSYYLKIGPLTIDFQTQSVHNLQSIKEWYLGEGDQEIIQKASQLLLDMLPGLEVEMFTSATCATCASPSFMPYIDRISPTVTVAVAGNGRGAKISEEAGRIAARLSLTGQWTSEVPQRLFHVIPAEYSLE